MLPMNEDFQYSKDMSIKHKQKANLNIGLLVLDLKYL